LKTVFLEVAIFLALIPMENQVFEISFSKIIAALEHFNIPFDTMPRLVNGKPVTRFTTIIIEMKNKSKSPLSRTTNG